MEKELGSDIIKATQTSLGKYIKRPPLSEKLLRKPPFRFLHDIITTVIKTSGFFDGLFEENELISENVKDRESKILFLTKVISVLGSATGKTLTVKPSKIVAGQEPDKTNELLQCLAQALDKKISSDEAVKKYKESANPGTRTNDIKSKEKDVNTGKKSNDKKRSSSKSTDNLAVNKKDPGIKGDKKVNENKNKKKELVKNDTNVKKSQSTKLTKKQSVDSTTPETANSVYTQPSQKNIASTINNVEHDDVDNNARTTLSETSSPEKELSTTNHEESHNEKNLDEITEGTIDISFATIENKLDSSQSSQDIIKEENVQPDYKNTFESSPEIHDVNTETKEDTKKHENLQIQDKPLSANKPTLVPVTKKENDFQDTKIKEPESDNITNTLKQKEIIRPPSVRPSSSRPGAPRLREKNDNIMPDTDNLLLAKVNIIAESTSNEEEESSVIIVEQHLEQEPAGDGGALPPAAGEHGRLVQQILDSQKEFSQASGKTEIEWQFGAHKTIESVNQEIEQLRYNIQAVSRVANPLGKLLDHIQEDVEIMRQELQQWSNVYVEVSKDMLKQKIASEDTLVPLQSRLKQLDLDIEEKHDKINDLKIMIHKNSSRIEKLLANGNVQ